MRAYAEQNALLRSLYNAVLEEPVPRRCSPVTPAPGDATPRRR